MEELREGRKYRFAGIISILDVKYTKREGKPFAVMAIEDFTGSSEVIIWNDVYSKYAKQLEKGAVIIISAKVEVDSRSETRRLTGDKLRVVTAEEAAKKAAEVGNALPTNGNGNGSGNGNGNGHSSGLTLSLGCRETTEADLLEIRDVVRRYPGDEPLRLAMKTTQGRQVTLVASGDYSVRRDPDLLAALGKWL